MWSKEESRNRKKRFFTAFGVYMKKHKDEYGGRIRWVNYRTGVNAVKFRIEADNKNAFVCIDVINKDKGIREVFFEQFIEFKNVLKATMTELIWEPSMYLQNGEEISRIYTVLEGKSINNEADWGDIFRFFEHNLIALHNFWDLSQDVFKDLED